MRTIPLVSVQPGKIARSKIAAQNRAIAGPSSLVIVTAVKCQQSAVWAIRFDT
jgi:hypothetical protein